jgi:hypothetical protein
VDQGCQRHGGEQDLGRAHAEDRLAHDPQPRRLQLEADHEQQQYDAEFREVQDPLDVGEQPESPGPDQNSGHQVAEHGAQIEVTEDRYGDDGGRQQDCDLDCQAHGCLSRAGGDGSNPVRRAMPARSARTGAFRR